jgi:hypothetical protein
MVPVSGESPALCLKNARWAVPEQYHLNNRKNIVELKKYNKIRGTCHQIPME